MAKHKAPTQVSFAGSIEESPLQEFVEKHWKTAVVLALLCTAAILGNRYVSDRDASSQDASWNRLRSEVTLGGGFIPTIAVADAGRLSDLADELRDQPAGPWAQALVVSKLIEEKDFEGARAALDKLEAQYPGHALVTEKLRLEEDGARTSVPAQLRSRLAATEAWNEAHPWLFANAPLPGSATRVRLTTTAGAIVVGLYEEAAPKHCGNFLKLCREGVYNNTKFHRVVPGFMIQGGDPNSIEGEPETWGSGGPGYKIDPEPSQLRHFKHVLAAAKQGGETQSSGSQFYLTTGTPHHLDGQHTVFGALLEGQAVLASIETGELDGERPKNPVTLLSAEVLE